MPISDAQPQPSRRPLLEFKDVDTYYGELHVLKRVNYVVGEGEIVALLGGNASGKSTTMKTIFGIVRPSSGTVSYNGAVINTMAMVENDRTCSMMTISMAAIMAGKTLPKAVLALAASSIDPPISMR